MCIGDAIHRHPPSNGLGSNTCISDAFNVAWKLAFVINGLAGPALLETLSSERKPVGDAIVRRANDGMLAHRELWALLGLTPEDRERALSQLQSPTLDGRAARQRFNHALQKTDLEFQAPGIQMNQMYLDSAATYVQPEDQKPDHSHLDLLKDIAVSTYPGHHLPHVWLAASGQTPRVSTLDLCGHGSFTLLTGNGGACWLEAAKAITASTSGIPTKAFRIGFRCDFMDLYMDWARCRSVEEDGVVLVRPDHFVGWRCHTSSADALTLLRKAMAHILSNDAIAMNSK